jgi:arsenate reductase
MPTTVYGIPNCDTVKKARAWLDAEGVPYAFHDYKKSGIDAAKLDGWCRTLGWETVLNRSGTTFRKLPDDQKSGLDREKAVVLMLAQPSMIKRPIVEHADGLLAGFTPEAWRRALKSPMPLIRRAWRPR